MEGKGESDYTRESREGEEMGKKGRGKGESDEKESEEQEKETKERDRKTNLQFTPPLIYNPGSWI